MGNQHLYINAIERGGRSYGTELVECTQIGGSLTPPGPHSDQCIGTFIFPDGQLTWQNGTASSSLAAPEDINIVITGGTKRYTRASGHGHVVVLAPGSTRQTLHLWLEPEAQGH
ncbi:hypothetical protein AB0C59_32305 [Streptomyces sp. NPDC048664]|uniref:hypothetical protein n=1 Tax=Streptomyces sp. NPDC048664 TaxID=3154505 RepID=UPI00342247DE